MEEPEKYASFRGRLILLGFGSVGQAVLPLLLRHFDIAPSQMRVISRSPDKSSIAAEYGVEFTAKALPKEITKSSWTAACARVISC